VVRTHRWNRALHVRGLSRPQRNGYVFAAAFSVLYAIIDAATVGFVGIFSAEFALSMLGNLLAALAGTFVAARKKSETGSTR
jgi:hypothetical protein